MEAQNTYFITCDEYSKIDTQKISRIIMKNGDILEVNNIINLESNYEINSLSRNAPYSFNSINSYNSINNKDISKIKKFNSYSAKARYNNRSPESFHGFYVTPVLNSPKKIIKIQVPEYDIDLSQKTNYNVQNFVFKSSPKKYNYKPYKPPKRKHNIKTVYYNYGQNRIQSGYNGNNKM
jgi:hypothetical protein